MSGISISKKFGIAAAVSFGVMLIPAAFAWACISLANMNATPTGAGPGQSVTLTGHEFYGTNPISIHFDALGGPVLATVTADSNGNFSQSLTIPPDATPGPHVLIATEPAATATSKTAGASAGVPARAVINVTPNGTSNAPVSFGPSAGARPSGVVSSSSSARTGVLVLVALGVLGVALFIAGGIALATGDRRKPAAEAVRS